MTQPYRIVTATLACALLVSTGAAQAQASDPSTDSNVPPATARKQAREIARGDPSRWFREDASMAARLASLHKEIGAGLQEAHGACRKLPTAERAGCVKQARATYQQDMAGARSQVMADSGR
ncbi:hypothetical protein [Massilia psychrophila]|uniref:UrcA family protein n=1 Tax=Massilia psychrophila TaxID=1603353 RepID=A0A2G8SXV2_9BURK|nr:hypothetical protein [Massilia psychrophila]PIL38626.1 hypothetical protein CR103_17095 [Massilia psychrophila]GGE69419.1 hypothetical protein GCM10008020_12350 [Massilia psychrophila]